MKSLGADSNLSNPFSNVFIAQGIVFVLTADNPVSSVQLQPDAMTN